MKVRIESYWLPKDGNSDSEYEDAFYPAAPRGIERDGQCLNLAIADGATETSFSGLWAKYLVNAYAQKPLAFESTGSLAKLLCKLGSRLNHRIGHVLSGPNVPWYAERKARDGAYAAILGLTLQEDQAKKHDDAVGQARLVRWKACAFGDCCVFQVRDCKLIKSFPLENASEFNNRPCLLCSNPGSNDKLADYRKLHPRRVQYGDELFLMTDALACWFLQCWELQKNPLELLSDIPTNTKFADLIASQRREFLTDGTPLLRNDDVTMLRCLIRRD